MTEESSEVKSEQNSSKVSSPVKTPVPAPRQRRLPSKYDDFVMTKISKSQSVRLQQPDWKERADYLKVLIMEGAFNRVSDKVSESLLDFVTKT